MIFSKTLNGWYSINKRDLPWRQTKTPYNIWLSEIILQQTQIKQGLPYYEAFLKKFPTVFDLAKAEEQDVLKLWQGLGYYSRARNIHATAKYIVSELDGVFPNTYTGLLKLKGVGDYTASAMASICFNEPTAVVDGNVYRVLARYFGVETPINNSKGIKEFKTLAQELIDHENPADYNQAIMEFGAVQCKPQNPDCSVCPFNNTCFAFSKNQIQQLPVKIKAEKAKKKYFNFLVIISKEERTILEKREGKGIWQNLYQFPLIETSRSVNLDEFPSFLNNHDILKSLNFELSLYNQEAIVHKLSHQHLYTKFWILTTHDSLTDGITFNEIHKYPVPLLIENFIKDFNF